MVTCSGCGKPIENIPNWLSGVKTEFVCNNCPNRSTKNIAILSAEIERQLSGAAAAKAGEEDADVEELADDEADED
ncbi:hypothetical protein EON79_18265 [bacterium]|nr:MAG: hypothetical protein EON79_18265 [bacterium]